MRIADHVVCEGKDQYSEGRLAVKLGEYYCSCQHSTKTALAPPMEYFCGCTADKYLVLMLRS